MLPRDKMESRVLQLTWVLLAPKEHWAPLVPRVRLVRKVCLAGSVRVAGGVLRVCSVPLALVGKMVVRVGLVQWDLQAPQVPLAPRD